jgi:hypothetical protein
MVTPASSASQVPAGGQGIEAENPGRIAAAGAGSAWRERIEARGSTGRVWNGGEPGARRDWPPEEGLRQSPGRCRRQVVVRSHGLGDLEEERRG